MRQVLRIGAVLVFSSAFISISAAEVTLQASLDNTLYESLSGSLSNGAGDHLFAGSTQTGAIRRALLWFDLSVIPTGSTIESVTVTLHMSRTVVGNQMVTLHSVESSWGEGASNATFEEGSGAAAQAGDATWRHRFFDTTFWDTEGGDFSAESRAEAAVGGVGAYTWGSTTGLIADVQNWVDQPELNFGWLLAGNELAFGTSKRFDSRENPTLSNRPLLRVTYTPPIVSGDANGDGVVNVSDIFYLINHLFAEGPAPVGPGDANGDGAVSVTDIFYLINHLFAGGPAPE